MESSELNQILDQHQLWLAAQGGSRANLEGANLYNADLTGAYLQGANLTGANLEAANLSGANLTGAYLHGANLSGADLTGAYLHGTNLSGANLTDANLSGANLTRAILTNTILPDISWIIPGCLVQLNNILYGFYLEKERKGYNFVQDSFGFIVQNNPVEKTFDMLVEDQIIRDIPDWVKFSGLKQAATECMQCILHNFSTKR
jgi:hypothetical protein